MTEVTKTLTTYEGWTCNKCICETLVCARIGGNEGCGGCYDACTSVQNEENPAQWVGWLNQKNMCSCCYTGDMGADGLEQFNIDVELPPSSDLTPLCYLCCINVSCWLDFPAFCKSAAECKCCLICMRAEVDQECNICPFKSCALMRINEECCDMQSHHGEDKNFCNLGDECECFYVLSIKQHVELAWRLLCSDGEMLCIQSKAQVCCLSAYIALPPTNEVPCALACCGMYCMGGEYVEDTAPDPAYNDAEMYVVKD